MASAKGLAQSGHTAKRINTTAEVHLGKIGEGYEITSIDPHTEAEVPRIDEQTFLDQAE